MKNLYTEYFYVPKDGKIGDKVMLTRVVTTVIIMLFCLAAMSFTAYAYFSYNVTSEYNIIKSANFDATITVSDNGTPVTVTNAGNNEYRVDLEEGKTYDVTVTKEISSTAETGFCVVSAEGCPYVYHTQQIGKDKNAPGGVTTEVSFKITVKKDATVSIVAHWGTSSYYDSYKDKGTNNELYVENNEQINIVFPILLFSPSGSGSVTDTTDADTSDVTVTPDSETTSPEVTTDASETTSPNETTAEIIHIVKQGEYVALIARNYGVDYMALAAYNNLKNIDHIIIGQKLKIPPKDWTPPTDTTAETTSPAATDSATTEAVTTEAVVTVPVVTTSPEA